MSDVTEIRASARHIQISPQKARLVVDVVRGMDANDALDTLRFMPHKAAEPVFKLVASAIANAEENFGIDAEELYVYKIFADDGPRHRLRPYGGRFGARGRFKPIINRSAHLTVILSDRLLDEDVYDNDDDEYEDVDEFDDDEETLIEEDAADVDETDVDGEDS